MSVVERAVRAYPVSTLWGVLVFFLGVLYALRLLL